jgi:hypothetical protein
LSTVDDPGGGHAAAAPTSVWPRPILRVDTSQSNGGAESRDRALDGSAVGFQGPDPSLESPWLDPNGITDRE